MVSPKGSSGKRLMGGGPAASHYSSVDALGADSLSPWWWWGSPPSWPILTSVRACSCPWCTHTPMNLEEDGEDRRVGCKSPGPSIVPTFPAGSFLFSQQASQQAAGAAHLRMLGCRSRFISCTSRSVFPRLLGSLFIFSTMTCPDCRCLTWGRHRFASPGQIRQVARVPLVPASRLRLGPAPLPSLMILPCRPQRRSRPRSSRRSGNRPRAPGWTRRCGEPGRRRGGPGPGLHPCPPVPGAPPPAPLPALAQGPAVGAVPRPWPGPQPGPASHGRVARARAGRACHGRAPSQIRDAGAPAPALENGRSAEDLGPAPAAPACRAWVDAAPLCSAQGLGLGLGRAVAVALLGAGGQAGGLPAGGGGLAGGRAAAAPLSRWGSGSAACRGRG